MEGGALALRHIMETMVTLDAPIENLLAVGNGLASSTWRQIVADVLARPLHQPVGQEKTGVGAALVAGLGCGLFSSYAEISQQLPVPSEITTPIAAHVDFYAERSEQFRGLYPLLQSNMHRLSGSG